MEVHDADGEFLASDWALNEVAVEKTVRQRLLLVDVYFDGTFFARVPADALILATATGSTAYALSAGGPIVSPRVAATLVVPVAPHSLFDRTVVAGPEEVVRVELLEGQASGLASCDGRDPVALGPGATVTVVGGPDPCARPRRADRLPDPGAPQVRAALSAASTGGPRPSGAGDPTATLPP
jgi:NAD+ kinase